MDITLDMLHHALRPDYPDVRLEAGSETAVVRQIMLHHGPLLRKETLYLREGCLSFEERSKGRLVFPGSADDLLLLEGVLACRDRLQEWDDRICEDILSQRSIAHILPLAQPYLPYPYSLVDREMRLLYESPYRPSRDRELSEPRGEGSERYVPEETVNALMLQSEFHRSLRNRDSFYFFDTASDRNCYCRNIFAADVYYATLILFLPGRDSRLSRGEEHLFSHFARRVEQLVRGRADDLRLPSADALQDLCRALVAGEERDSSAVGLTLQRAGWTFRNAYAVLALRFMESSSWSAHPEISLPYLLTELKRRWPESCPFSSGEQLLCVINLSRTLPDGDGGELLPAFCEELALFVREHACHAGISSVCESFADIRRAAAQARSALELGHGIAPDRWYFLFDDCRLEYMLQELRTHALPELGPHPVLKTLSDYDRDNNTEMVATLRAYLDANLNMQAAADRLYIHRTTFCRRMDRIRELVKTDLFTPEMILQLGLSVRLSE